MTPLWLFIFACSLLISIIYGDRKLKYAIASKNDQVLAFYTTELDACKDALYILENGFTEELYLRKYK